MHLSKTYTLFLACSILLFAAPLQAQNNPLPITFWHNQSAERLIASVDSTQSTTVKPLNEKHFQQVYFFDKSDSLRRKTWLGRKAFQEHLGEIKEGEIRVSIDPLFEGKAGSSWLNDAQTNIYTNTRGVLVQADLGPKFSMQSAFFENQAFFPEYVRNFIVNYGVVPGQGRTKKFRDTGFDYSSSFGHLSWEPCRFVSLQMGYGRQFIGSGYRSILLSDAAFNYPYIKAVGRWWKNRIQYTTSFAELQSLRRQPLGQTAEALFKQKAASFHFLNILPHPRVEIGLFESIIWQRWDSTGTLPANLGMFVPVIGYNTASIGFGQANNVLVGLNAKVKITNNFSVYGQFAKAGTNHKGFQIGTRLFNVGLKKLDVQLEWNSLGKFLYNNSNVLQSYTHFNQPLGSPVGPFSDEYLAIVSYEWKRIRIFTKLSYIDKDLTYFSGWESDPNENYIDLIDSKKRVVQGDLRVSYVFNRFTQAQISLGATSRLERYTFAGSSRSNQVIYLSFSTNLFQQYYDF